MRNIHAFTETTTTSPGYISINEEAGKLTVSVRSRGAQNVSVVEMNRDQLEGLAWDILAHLGVTMNKPAAPVISVGDLSQVSYTQPAGKKPRDKA